MSDESFKDQSWSNRYQGMGDIAEGEFERVMSEERNLGYVRWGLDRPPLQVHKLPERIRFAPDYLTTKCFVEVQGFGRDQVVKLKIAKYDVLRFYRTIHPVQLFLFDSANVRHTFVELEKVTALLPKATIREFPEGTSYYAFGADLFFPADAT